MWTGSAGMRPGCYMRVRRSESGGPRGNCNVAPAAATPLREDAAGHTDDSGELNVDPSGSNSTATI